MAIRKCYRKEGQLTTKSESIAKIYVIENGVVMEEKRKKTEGSQNMRVDPDELLKTKGEKTELYT